MGGVPSSTRPYLVCKKAYPAVAHACLRRPCAYHNQWFATCVHATCTVVDVAAFHGEGGVGRGGKLCGAWRGTAWSNFVRMPCSGRRHPAIAELCEDAMALRITTRTLHAGVHGCAHNRGAWREPSIARVA